MNPRRVARDADVVLYAAARAWAREGDVVLTSDEIAGRVGRATAIDRSIFDLLIDEGWLREDAGGYRITEQGQSRVRSMDFKNSKVL